MRRSKVERDMMPAQKVKRTAQPLSRNMGYAVVLDFHGTPHCVDEYGTLDEAVARAKDEPGAWVERWKAPSGARGSETVVWQASDEVAAVGESDLPDGAGVVSQPAEIEAAEPAGTGQCDLDIHPEPAGDAGDSGLLPADGEGAALDQEEAEEVEPQASGEGPGGQTTGVAAQAA